MARQHYVWGQADVDVFVRFGREFIRRPRLRDQLVPWRVLARLTLSLRSADARRRWTWRAAHRLGRIRGSIRHRVLLI